MEVFMKGSFSINEKLGGAVDVWGSEWRFV